MFHGACRAQTVQGVHYKISIAQPTVTVVPVTAATRSFRNGCGHRGDYGPGVIVGVQFERNGCADNCRLPFKGDAEITYPLVPILYRLLEKMAPPLTHSFVGGFVGAPH